jgi:hypothetical protein
VPKQLRILAWVHVVLGGAGLGLCAAFVAAAVIAHDPAYEDELAFFAWLLGMGALVYFMPSFFGGLGLLKRWPWARALIWLESPFLAVLVPVGTVLAGFNLWVLLSTREISADGGIAKFEYFVRRAVRPLVLMLIALFILGVIVGVGYLFRDVIDPPKKQILTPMPSGVPDTSDIPKFEYVPPTLPRAPGP